MSATTAAMTPIDSTTVRLLRAGATAGPLYIMVGLGQILLRDGFDMRRHALSLLSNGSLGWIQVANFILSGALVIAGAVGARRVLTGQLGGTWLPILLGIFGASLIGAGLFRADPAQGFPPGSTAPPGMTRSGFLHFAFGAVGFYALIIATLVLARRYLRIGWRKWMTYSLVTGLGFLLVFGMVASGRSSGTLMLLFYAAVAWIWIWHSRVMSTLAQQPSVPR